MPLHAAPDATAPPRAPVTPLIKPARPVLVHAPDPLAEPVARLEAEMTLSAVIVAAELCTPRPAATAVLAPPHEPPHEPAPAVTRVYPIVVEPSLQLDEFAVAADAAEAPPEIEVPPDADEQPPPVAEQPPVADVPDPAEAPMAAPAPSSARRRATGWILGLVAAVGLILCLVLLAVGSQAPASQTRYPMRNVVGMQDDEARAVLAQDGVQISTVRADHGPVGVVLKESGFAADGTYGPGSEIVLLVGGGN